jgi:hypothetical protein
MQLKWYFTLVFITILFIISSFFIAETVGFRIPMDDHWNQYCRFYLLLHCLRLPAKKTVKKMMGGNLAAIVLKFILSSVVIIIYILLFGMRNQLDFAFFF